jgi:hypothetical protein
MSRSATERNEETSQFPRPQRDRSENAGYWLRAVVPWESRLSVVASAL